MGRKSASLRFRFYPLLVRWPSEMSDADAERVRTVEQLGSCWAISRVDLADQVLSSVCWLSR